MTQTKRLKKSRLALIPLALLLIALAWWQVLAAGTGLVQRDLERGGVPLRYIAAAGEETRPGVVIAHGFSGSRQLMLAYAYTFAHAGYGVMLLDFDGHGANLRPLNSEGDVLQANLAEAYGALLEQPGIDPSQVALLGHSMGSGAVMRAGINNPDQYAATIAISPTGADVTTTAPRNLQLQAGALEPPFAAQARALLAEAGGLSAATATGLGRDLLIVPGVEHISILFAPTSHEAALRWLDQVFGYARNGDYRDSRIIWFAVQLAGALLLWFGLAPWLPLRRMDEVIEGRRTNRALVAAPLAATLLLALVNMLFPVAALGGLLVGGGLALWLFFAGVVWVGLGYRPDRPVATDLLWGLIIFAFLWLAFGVMSQVVWLPWFLGGQRRLLWVFVALACVPWQWAAAAAQTGRPARARFWAWLLHAVFFTIGLVLATMLVPGVGFLILVIPLLPALLALFAFAGHAIDRPWPVALGSAAFFAWVIVVVFPLTA